MYSELSVYHLLGLGQLNVSECQQTHKADKWKHTRLIVEGIKRTHLCKRDWLALHGYSSPQISIILRRQHSYFI